MILESLASRNRFSSLSRPFALIALSGAVSACAPQSAELLAGDYTVWVAEGTSVTLAKDNLVDEDFERHSIYDCQYFDLADPFQKASVTTGMSKGLKKKVNALRHPDRERVCPDDDAAKWVQHEAWLYKAAYHVVGGELDPWRGEAIITSEGDFQISFHQRVPGHKDMRFSIAIDPDFQPTECRPNADGSTVSMQNIDGGSWLDQWSKKVDGQLYFVNAGAYQFDPDASSLTPWYIPNEWMAGYAGGKFIDDLLRSRSTRYGSPSLYVQTESNVGGQALNFDASELYYCSERAAPSGPAFEACMKSIRSRAADDAKRVRAELTIGGLPADGETLPSARPVIEDNAWRDPDNLASGLDRWDGLQYSWIRFDEGSDLTVGGAASGEFSVFFDGTQSGVRMYVRGTFNVDRIHKDLWYARDLPPIKRDQNNTPKCGE